MGAWQDFGRVAVMSSLWGSGRRRIGVGRNLRRLVSLRHWGGLWSLPRAFSSRGWTTPALLAWLHSRSSPALGSWLWSPDFPLESLQQVHVLLTLGTPGLGAELLLGSGKCLFITGTPTSQPRWSRAPSTPPILLPSHLQPIPWWFFLLLPMSCWLLPCPDCWTRLWMLHRALLPALWSLKENPTKSLNQSKGALQT